jgi:3-hydroxyethyl bacteriochlorophyllide a dehydrogenase
MIQAKAIAMTGVGTVEFVPVEVPAPDPGELLIRTEVTTVSRGTELRCLAGQQPNAPEFPFIPGYSSVGVVEAVNGDSPVRVGTRVFCKGTKRASANLQWGAHISHAVADSAEVVPIPGGCSPKMAVFAKMVAIALRGSRVTQPRPSDCVAVVGLGPIGLLSLRLFHAAGANVFGLDQEASRGDIARRGCLAAGLVQDSIEEAVHNHFGRGADIVVDVTGVPAVLPSSMRAAKSVPWGTDDVSGAKLVIQGSYPDSFSLPYQAAFEKELHIILPRDQSPADLQQAVTLIAAGACKVDDLTSWIGPPTEAKEAYRLLRTDRSAMTIAFDWSEVS